MEIILGVIAVAVIIGSGLWMIKLEFSKSTNELKGIKLQLQDLNAIRTENILDLQSSIVEKKEPSSDSKTEDLKATQQAKVPQTEIKTESKTDIKVPQEESKTPNKEITPSEAKAQVETTNIKDTPAATPSTEITKTLIKNKKSKVNEEPKAKKAKANKEPIVKIVKTATNPKTKDSENTVKIPDSGKVRVTLINSIIGDDKTSKQFTSKSKLHIPVQTNKEIAKANGVLIMSSRHNIVATQKSNKQWERVIALINAGNKAKVEVIEDTQKHKTKIDVIFQN